MMELLAVLERMLIKHFRAFKIIVFWNCARIGVCNLVNVLMYEILKVI